MTYIWEVLLRADAQGFPRNKIRFRQTETPAPYMELAYEELNREIVDTEPVEVNGYYRFGPIFDFVLDDAMQAYPELQSTLYDILMHYLAEINIREGLCKKEYYGLFLRGDVRNEGFGKTYKEVFKTFPRGQVRFVAESMVRLYEIGPSVMLLRTVLKQLYPQSILYLDCVDNRELLVYIGREETPELGRQVGFLLDMFVPFDYITHLFWDMHFGILDINETLELGNFILY